MTEEAHEPAEQGWIERLLSRSLPMAIQRLKNKEKASVEWLQTELHSTVLPMLGDVAAFAREVRDEFGSQLMDHEMRLIEVEAFVEALGQETQLVPSDADDVAKLAGGAKLLASELLASAEQTEEGKARLAELVVIAERVQKMVATARLDAEPSDDEDEDEGDLDEN
jgi:hypothetical protein